MIRFCDKEVWQIEEHQLTREQMICFFETEGRKTDVIAIYTSKGIYKGIVLYEDLIKCNSIDDCINPVIIKIGIDFWEKATKYFEKNPNALLTILDDFGRMIGFAYNDQDNYAEIYSVIETMKKGKKIPALSLEKYKRIQLIVLNDFNEIAYRSYQMFSKLDIPVYVKGEKWAWFGIENIYSEADYPEYAKIYIYAEGTEFIRTEQKLPMSRYNYVANNFFILVQMAWDSMKLVYDNEINRLLRKGIHVCECHVPTRDKLNNMTDLEQLSVMCNLSIGARINRPWLVSERDKEAIAKIYGHANIELLLEKGNVGNAGNVQMIPIGNLLGRSIKDVQFQRKIYLIGPCIAYGYGCLAEDSLYGKLQEIVGKYEYQVVSLFIPREKYDILEVELKNIPIHEQDILLVVYDMNWFPVREKTDLLPQVDISAIYEASNRKTLFSQIPLHTNPDGNYAMAKEIFERYLKDEMNNLKCKDNVYLQKGEWLSTDAIKEIEEYLNGIVKKESGTVGAIVMNCNPFTYGHRYLVEYAADRVDFLYVFVVEEDRSLFRFADRFLMVQQGTADIPNVIVVPSGKWIVSYRTFTSYFEKEIKQDVKVDAYGDLEIFARYIAPPLRITQRFVGEEPFDKVTEKYNQQMCEVLGQYNISVKIVERLCVEGRTISATYVRECMREKKWEETRKYLPPTSYKICRQYSY